MSNHSSASYPYIANGLRVQCGSVVPRWRRRRLRERKKERKQISSSNARSTINPGARPAQSGSITKNNESDPWEGSLSLIGLLLKSVLSDQRWGSAKLFATRIRIQRLIIPFSDLRRRAGGPIEGRIENITAVLGVPSQPGMSLPARSRPLANDEADIRCSVVAHLFVEGDGFSFAVRRGTGLGFRGCFPKGGKAVGNRAKVVHPLINDRDRDLRSGGMGRSGQERPNSGHLMVVWGRTYREEEGIRKGRRGGEGQEQAGEEKRLFHG